MKNILKIALASVLLLSTLFVSCNTQSVNKEEETTTSSPAENTTEENTAENTTSEETTTLADVSDETTSSNASSESTPENDPPKSLKILAIGNSFSTDAMQYLYQIAKDAGVETIVLGNLYYGGCSLAQHLDFAKSNSASYKYYKNTSGTWGSTANYKMEDALKDEEWDYITLQQTSKTCGLQSSYGATLTQLVDYVRTKNTDAKLVWHMTWAYQQDSTHSSFPNYDNSQQKMYDMIIDCVKNCIEPETRFNLVIPCMTSIQNARTSFLGDTLTRDGYHLDYNIGRYIAGLTYYAAITGAPIDNIKYNPSTDMISEDMIAVAKESVKNAIAKPYEITNSKILTGSRPESVSTTIDPTVVLDPADFFIEDVNVAERNGVDLNDYVLLEWDYLTNTYWNCTSKAGTTTPGSSGATYNQNVCSARKYSISELPAGTVFICDSGWQYRLEIYKEENKKYDGTRPGLSTEQFFVLNESFLNGCQYISWNIASSPKSDISSIFAQAACHLRIYVPKSALVENQ